NDHRCAWDTFQDGAKQKNSAQYNDSAMPQQARRRGGTAPSRGSAHRRCARLHGPAPTDAPSVALANSPTRTDRACRCGRAEK
ncbi:MAG: hypothetical protein ACYCW7_17955, partial [Pseudomonadaceae bacterium]